MSSTSPEMDNTLKCIAFVQDRPQQWQKEHREFMNRAIRNKLFKELARMCGLPCVSRCHTQAIVRIDLFLRKAYMWASDCVCVCVCVCVCRQVCMYTCVSIPACAWTHTHTHTHTQCVCVCVCFVVLCVWVGGREISFCPLKGRKWHASGKFWLLNNSRTHRMSGMLSAHQLDMT